MARLCHKERSAVDPFSGLSTLDSEGTSLAFIAREVLSLSRILLSVHDASSGRRERNCHRCECARSDDGREGDFLLGAAEDRFFLT